MSKVTKNIFNGLTHVIPMADVSHVQRHWFSSDTDRTKDNCRGLVVVMKHTTWNQEIDYYNNNPYLEQEEAKEFLKCWYKYRSEVESEALSDPHRLC